jgi:uroporphyrinogen-III decarboxylase
MFEDKEDDWKELLAPEDQDVISDLLDSAKRHRGAFMHADDVKVSQLWCALIEMKKELEETRILVRRAEAPFKDMVSMAEIEKRKTVEKLVRDMIRAEPDKEEVLQKLVDSLMRF